MSSAHATPDLALAERIGARDTAAFEQLMRQHNPRLFRVVRAILKDDAEAEDALQEAYIDAYRHIGEFEGRAQFGTWLTRIAINHALMRLRKRGRDSVVVSIDQLDGGDHDEHFTDRMTESPVSAALRTEMRTLLERCIDQLPIAFRTVFVMREIDEMSVEETAQCLSIPAATVRTRLFRARALLRNALARDMDLAARDVFSFDGPRCDRIVAAVLDRL